MADPTDKQRERELRSRREAEIKDLEVERTIGPRPLEGFSGGGAGTTWTEAQDEAAAPEVHGDDEAKSRERSEDQIPQVPPEPGRH